MIRPCRFGFNEQTAVNNAFQKKADGDVQAAALSEFDAYVNLLRSYGVKVDVVEDTPSPATPDSIFPNNWFSVHEGGILVLYPMFAANRREERKPGVVDHIVESCNVSSLIDLTPWEKEGKFLEGTGSMVLDRASRIAYACLSPRTDKDVLDVFCKAMEFRPVTFHAADAAGAAIYHTNVMMSVGSSRAVVCLDSIANPSERDDVMHSLESTGHSIVEITPAQMNCFAGNMLELRSDVTGSAAEGCPLQVMSLSALHSLTVEQRLTLSLHTEIVAPDLTCIETSGGGSARCMLAEIF